MGIWVVQIDNWTLLRLFFRNQFDKFDPICNPALPTYHEFEVLCHGAGYELSEPPHCRSVEIYLRRIEMNEDVLRWN